MMPLADYRIRKVLLLSFVLLAIVAVAIVTGNDLFGIRQIAGFLLLVFIPGILLLKIFKIHSISITESILYSVGLSISFVIAVGVSANFALPLFGIDKPISLYPMAIVIGLSILVLMAIAYFRDKNFRSVKSISLKDLWIPILIASLLTIFTVFGAVSHNNVMLFSVPVIISVIVIACLFWKKLKAYPIILYAVALCLLLQTTLLSVYLMGSDVIAEHLFHKYTLDMGYWVYTAPEMYASALSITILSPIYSLIFGASGIWIFKLVFPIIFALVPVALYFVYKQFLGKRLAFIAAFFSVVLPVFLLEMPSIMRQQISTLFLALILLMMFEQKIQARKKVVFLIVFSVALIATCYGLGVPYVFYISAGFVVFLIINRFFGRIRSKFSQDELSSKQIGIVLSVLLLFFIGYYSVIANGSVLLAIKNMVGAQTTQIIENPAQAFIYQGDDVPISESSYPVSGDTYIPSMAPPAPPYPSDGQATSDIIETERPSFLELVFSEKYGSPLIRTALGLDFASVTIHGKVFRAVQHIIHILIIIGFAGLFFARRKLRFPLMYVSMVIACISLILAYVFLPVVSSSMGATRFYYTSMIFLAPLMVFGGLVLFRWKERMYSIILLVLLIVPYFMFTSGLVFEAFGYSNTDRIDIPYSIAVSSHRIDVGGVFSDQDAQGAEFLANIFVEGDAVFMDFYSTMIVCDILDMKEYNKISPTAGVRTKIWLFSWDVSKVPDDVYIYLRSWNVAHREVTYYTGYGLRRIASWDEMDFERCLEGRELLYDNGSRVYSPRV